MNLKQKNRLLLGGFLLLFWICYKIPVAQTITAKKETEKLQNEHQLFSNIPQKIQGLTKETIYLDSILANYQFSVEKSFQSNLLQTITSFSKLNNLTVVSFEEPHIITKNKTTINTFEFSVRGNYNNSLRLIHELEQTKKLGKILLVNFEREKNYRTNKQFLETRILLQRLED